VIKALTTTGFNKETGEILSDEWRNIVKEKYSKQKDVMSRAMGFGTYVIN
jgi:hypothetical protein